MHLAHFSAIPNKNRRVIPIIAVLAAVITLVLSLGLYTSRNLTLSRHRLEEALLQEGMTLLNAIEAGNRTGMRMHWVLDHLQTLVEEIGKAPNVIYIRVFGRDTTILAQSLPTDVHAAPPETDLLTTVRAAADPLVRTVSLDDQTDVFTLMVRVKPSVPIPGESKGSMRMMPGMMRHGMMEGAHSLSEMTVIEIGLDLAELKELHARDLRQAVFMLIFLTVIGSAVLYVIVTSQNYYAVRYAFLTMKSYTRHVVESMANGLISLDTEGNIVTMNRQAYQILDLPAQQTPVGKSLFHVMSPDHCDLLESLATGTSMIEQDAQCTTLSGKIRHLSLSASNVIDDDGQRLGSVVLFRDLSDVKALQDQVKRAERLAALGKLAAGVAHEIRNPLGALKGFLQYFQRKLTLSEQDRTYLAVMVSEVDRLNAVISNLLDFARPQEPNLEPCALPDLLHHVVTLIESDARAKQVQVFLDISAHLPYVRLDRQQMTQVLLNLLLNAIQATPAGAHIRIQVRLQNAGSAVEFAVIDTGQGIAPDVLPRIFDPFFSTKKQGAGLGLAIAHTIIEQHQGNITAESLEGQGSAFRIHLPIG